jgi:heme exporter protein C
MRLGGSTIHPDILKPLLWSALGFTLLFFALHMKGMRNEILRRRVKSLSIAEVEHARAAEATGAAE